MDRGAWRAAIHGVTKSRTRLSNWTELMQGSEPGTCPSINVLCCYFILFIYLNWRPITILWWFCHTLTWISHRCTCVPHPEPPSHLPLHPTPMGCPSALALSALFHALNLGWSSISHIIIYIFQCYSLKPSHARLLPQSPKVCSLHLCLLLSHI